MKLIYFANIRIPTEKAHGLQIMKTCEALSLAGFDLELVVPSRKNKALANQDPFAYYSVRQNFKLKKLFTLDPRWLLHFPAGSYIKIQGLLFIISLFFYLLKYQGKKETIFYTRDEYLLPILQKFSDRVVWEGHSLPNKKQLYAKYFKRCDKLLVLTSTLKQNLIELGMGEGKVKILPDAVDLEIFDVKISKEEARKRINLPKDKIILGYTGSFKTKGMDKGIGDILKSLSEIIKQKKNVLFVAVGGSPEEINYYQQIAADNGVTEYTLFLAKVSQIQLAVYQKAFDVLLMPFPYTKHYAYYMSPLKMFEYLASQRPIIATDLPSVLDVLDDQSAVLIKPGDTGQLTRAVLKLSDDEVLAKRLSANAYSKAGGFTWQTRAEKIKGFLTR